MQASTRSARAVRWGAVFGAWTVLSVIVATQTRLRSDTPASWGALLLFQLAYWYGWGLVTPLIFELARRFPFERGERGRVLRAALVHTLCGSLVSLVMLAYFTFLMQLVLPPEHPQHGLAFGQLFAHYTTRGFHYDVLTYAAVLAVGIALQLKERVLERSLRNAQLESKLAEARLAALRMQLQPHFLFNTLHSIAALTEEEPGKARRMIAMLSELLRVAFQGGDRAEIPLREELELVDRYIEIETTRFADLIEVERSVDPTCLDARVPSLVLQPLVENSIRHGLRSAHGVRIEIRARREGGQLELSVRDDGAADEGSESSEASGERAPRADGQGHLGVGLPNVRARLEYLYGERAVLEAGARREGGFRVDLSLPFREVPA